MDKSNPESSRKTTTEEFNDSGLDCTVHPTGEERNGEMRMNIKLHILAKTRTKRKEKYTDHSP